MKHAQHSTGKRERPTFAGITAFILLIMLPVEFVAQFIVDTVGAHTVGIILIILTLVSLEACCETLETNEGKHTREDNWTTGYWGVDDRFTR